MMETNTIDSRYSPYVYTSPDQAGPAKGFQFAMRVVLLVIDGAGLIAVISWLHGKIISDPYFPYVIYFVAFVYVLCALDVIQNRWFGGKNRHYTVSLGNYGLSVKGAHPLNGKYIRWQEIGKIRLALYPVGLEITTYGEAAKLTIHCEQKRLTQLISLIAQYIEVNQPQRTYPEQFTAKYRYVKLVLFISSFIITVILAHLTQDTLFLALIPIIGIFWLYDASSTQIITLVETEVIFHQLWRARPYPYTAIKHILFSYEPGNHGVLHHIVLVTDDREKPAYMLLNGFGDPILIYLALHQAWRKARTGRIQPNLGIRGYYTTGQTHGEKTIP